MILLVIAWLNMMLNGLNKLWCLIYTPFVLEYKKKKYYFVGFKYKKILIYFILFIVVISKIYPLFNWSISFNSSFSSLIYIKFKSRVSWKNYRLIEINIIKYDYLIFLISVMFFFSSYKIRGMIRLGLRNQYK